jgi:hypothetical protein
VPRRTGIGIGIERAGKGGADDDKRDDPEQQPHPYEALSWPGHG